MGPPFLPTCLLVLTTFFGSKGTSCSGPYESSPGAYREFCELCGTQVLVHGHTPRSGVTVPSGPLDRDPPLNILGHMYTESQVAWFAITHTCPQYLQWPPGIRPKGGVS